MMPWRIVMGLGCALVLYDRTPIALAQETRPPGRERASSSMMMTKPLVSLKPSHDDPPADGTQLAAYHTQVAAFQQQLLAAEQQFNGWQDDLMAQQALLDQRSTELEQGVRQRLQSHRALVQRAQTLGERVSAAHQETSLVEWQRELAAYQQNVAGWETWLSQWHASVEQWSAEAKHRSKTYEVMKSYIASLWQELPALQRPPLRTVNAAELVASGRTVWKKSQELSQEMATFLHEVGANRATLMTWQQSFHDATQTLSDWDQSLMARGQRVDAWEQWVTQQIPADQGRSSWLRTMGQDAAVNLSPVGSDPSVPAQAGL